jgi:hypothetical protein
MRMSFTPISGMSVSSKEKESGGPAACRIAAFIELPLEFEKMV